MHDRELMNHFSKRYGRPPELTAEAPGRVNLIGEHTDYNGCPVLPVAIQYSVGVAAAGKPPQKTGRGPVQHAAQGRNRTTITIANTDPQFEDRMFFVEEEIPPFPQGDWGNYVKAGVRCIVRYFLGQGKKIEDYRGGDLMVHGTVPPAAGLSSSSALVVAAAIAFLELNGLTIEKEEFAGVLAEGERYVGTQGGGMDQAVALFGKEGYAVKIDFHPFKVESVPIPRGYTFLTAHSLVESAKTEQAMDRYNGRAAECRLGAELLRRAYEVEYGGATISLLGDISSKHLGITTGELELFISGALHPGIYSLRELSELFRVSPEETARRFCRRKDGSVMPEPPGGYKIYQRVHHVFSEWRRVEASVRALNMGEMEQFGMLMTASHASCRDLFEISCPELDRLTALLLAGGALGARLTGAGFGGCAVALVLP